MAKGMWYHIVVCVSIVSTCAGMMDHGSFVHYFKVSYHIYKDGWDAPTGEVLYCKWEIGNHSDPCAVAVNVAILGATASGV